ncbi:MAG: prepilin peptidase [Verrucomicrobiales bacterium]|nr:prepilin peptidase [Verrucomicrobiales bacterium]
MSYETFFQVVLPIAAFIIGSCVGSFLNVVIYRVPLGMSVNEPKRSFCPTCKTQIPAWLNIPLLTWLMLGGKCKWCRTPISPRYFVVELLTGLLFLAAWKGFYPPFFEETRSELQALWGIVAIWTLLALLVAATFIDFDHFIIPDSITLGGLVAGLVASVALPHLHQETSHWRALWQSVVGAAAGFGLLWAVVNLGKLAFGRLKYAFDTPTLWSISQPDEESNPVIRIGEDRKDWDEVFYRDSDRLVMEISEVTINGERREAKGLTIQGETITVDGEAFPLEQVKSIEGLCTKATVPREAMGFGDVKFIAMIGAFLGWEAVLFTVFAASIVGALVGILQKLVARESWTRPLPFGPYLTMGAILWIFAGPPLMTWYLRAMGFEL